VTLKSVLRDALGVEGGKITGVISQSPNKVVLGVAILADRAQRCSVCGARHSAAALIALAKLCMGGLCPLLPGRA